MTLLQKLKLLQCTRISFNINLRFAETGSGCRHRLIWPRTLLNMDGIINLILLLLSSKHGHSKLDTVFMRAYRAE